MSKELPEIHPGPHKIVADHSAVLLDSDAFAPEGIQPVIHERLPIENLRVIFDVAQHLAEKKKAEENNGETNQAPGDATKETKVRSLKKPKSAIHGSDRIPA